MCVVLVSCRRRCDVITPRQHRCDDILTSHACWEDEQLLLCGIIAHAKSSVVHHRGLPVTVSQLPSKRNVPYLFFRLNSFSISEEYASVYCRNYASHRISESYAERILFLLLLFFLQPVPSHPYPAILVCSVSSVCVLW